MKINDIIVGICGYCGGDVVAGDRERWSNTIAYTAHCRCCGARPVVCEMRERRKEKRETVKETT